MKIVKIPFDRQIKCSCGVEFEWANKDLKHKLYSQIKGCREYYITEVYVECPFCKHNHIIKSIER